MLRAMYMRSVVIAGELVAARQLCPAQDPSGRPSSDRWSLLDAERDAALPAVGADRVGIDHLVPRGAERGWLAGPGASDRIAAVLGWAARHLRGRTVAQVVGDAARSGQALIEVRRRAWRRDLV